MKFKVGIGITWLIASLAITACGFHFRGGDVAGLPPIYIEGGTPTKGIRLALERSLRSSGAGATTTREQAKLILVLTQETYRKWPLSISTQLSVQEYELIYTVTFRITDPTGKILTPAQSIEFTRDFSFSSTTQVLGKTNEEDLLRQEMTGDAARQILTQTLILVERHPDPLSPQQ